MYTNLELGRFPSEEECDEIKKLCSMTGSARLLQEWVLSHFDIRIFEKALEEKRNDVIVYLALRHFQKRLPLKTLSKRIQNDINACFPNFNIAWDTAKNSLFNIGNPNVISEYCNNSRIGRLDNQALYVKPNEVNLLDPVLRIYIQVGGLFYGNIQESHEIKIYKSSGKITFLQYEDPCANIPKTTIRVKIDLGRPKVEYYDHREPSGELDNHLTNASWGIFKYCRKEEGNNKWLK